MACEGSAAMNEVELIAAGRMTVKFCPFCKCKTWHCDNVCEWSDGHEFGLATG